MNGYRALASLTIAAALATLAACSSGGGGGGYSSPVTPPTNNPGPSNPPPASTTISSPPIAVSSTIITAAPNGTNPSNGAAWYNGGVTAWAPNAGDTSSGGNGTNTIDGTSCTQMTEPATGKLHVHAFVGLYVNGAEQGIPTAIGMWNPTQPTSTGSPSNNYSVPSASCFYHLHTHDYSGLIHIEDDTATQTYALGPVSYATLKTLFDIWGEPINANTVAAFNGSVAIYTGTPASGSQIVTSYTPFNGDLTTIQLGHHVAIWIVVGTPPAALPQLKFGVED
jgi:hypothetical protein